jgi:hypothetical protein
MAGCDLRLCAYCNNPFWDERRTKTKTVVCGSECKAKYDNQNLEEIMEDIERDMKNMKNTLGSLSKKIELIKSKMQGEPLDKS